MQFPGGRPAESGPRGSLRAKTREEHVLVLVYCFFFFLAVPRGMRDLSVPTGMEPMLPAVEVQSGEGIP